MLVNNTEAAPELVYHEPDEAFFLSLSLTHNRQHILLHGESHATHYVATLSAGNPTGELQFHWWQWLGPPHSAPVSAPESYTACQKAGPGLQLGYQALNAYFQSRIAFCQLPMPCVVAISWTHLAYL